MASAACYTRLARMPNATDEVVLSARELTKVYQMGEVEVHALRGVDMDLHAGEFLVLLGASGTATSGTVMYRSQNLTNADDEELTEFRRAHVGFVFQFYNLIPSLTAEENVRLVADIAEDPMEPKAALELVGLGPRKDHFPSQLSGGEQQRVAIARAVCKQPELLLCDEPTGALDFRTGILVLETLERVNRELGTTTAVITHNVPIAQMANTVVELVDGQVSRIEHRESRLPPSELRW
jgi:putative ABC transport system ATP-binding protein